MTVGILVAVVALVTLVGVAMLVAASRSRVTVEEGAGEAATGEPVFVLPESCRASGHAYQEYDTGWRCAGCGNHVPRQEGELYGLVSDGRHERRRESR